MLGFINIKLYQLMYLIQEQKISLVSKMNQKNNQSLLLSAPAKNFVYITPRNCYTLLVNEDMGVHDVSSFHLKFLTIWIYFLFVLGRGGGCVVQERKTFYGEFSFQAWGGGRILIRKRGWG